MSTSRTKEEIFNQMKEEMPWQVIGEEQLKPYILEAMQVYADQEVNVVREILELTYKTKLVSVNNKLPEMTEKNEFGKYSKPVICLHKDGHYEDCQLNESDDVEGDPYWSYVQDGEFCETVTHWMPVPYIPNSFCS